jgi:hypothetical protein
LCRPWKGASGRATTSPSGADLRVAIAVDGVSDHAAGRPGHHIGDVGLPDGGDDRASGGHRLDELAELVPHLIQVPVDVCVIELHRGDHQSLGVVVEKLGSLVEERRVVFVPLHHEVGAGAVAEASVEVGGDAPDQHGGVAAGFEEECGDDAAGGGLSVGSGHHHRVLPLDRVLVECVRKGEVGQSGFDGRLRLRIVDAHGVADHHQIRRSLQQVLGTEALRHRNSPGFEGRAHGRIHVGIRAGDFETPALQEPGEGPHAGSGDGDEVYVPHGDVRTVSPTRRTPR